MTNKAVSINKGSSLYIEGLQANVIDGVLGLWGISPGRCRDSNNLTDIELNMDPDSDFYLSIETVKNNFCGPGGVDLVSSINVASKIYAFYVIADSYGNNKTTSLCAIPTYNYIPTLPAGYDSYRLVGYTKSHSTGKFDDNTANVGIRNDRQMVYLNSQRVVNSPSEVVAKVALENFAPPVDALLVTFGVYYTGALTTSSLQYGSVNDIDQLYGYIQTQVNASVTYEQCNIVCQLDPGMASPAPVFFYQSGADDIPAFFVERFLFNV